MLESLRSEVLQANLALAQQGLARFTFGNASGIARDQGLVVIKPSGVPYETMTAADLVVVDLEGRTVALSPRQGFVVPKGTVHRTRAQQRTVILMVENAGIVPTGD